ILTASPDGVSRLWTAQGQIINSIDGSRLMYGAAWSPDSDSVAIACLDRKVWIWTHGTATETLEGHEDVITSLAWSPDGRLLATGSSDKTVRVWSLVSEADKKGSDGDQRAPAHAPARKWKTVLSIPHSAPVALVTWSPDGSRLTAETTD